MKRLVLYFFAGLLLIGALTTPIQVMADGDPGPSCPDKGVCIP